jgi:hypothetical protein
VSDDRETAWAELEVRAQRLLEHAREVEPRDVVRRYGSLLRLWHFPAFGPQRTWTILAPGRKAPEGARRLVRGITWDSPADRQRLEDLAHDFRPVPTIRLQEAPLPEDELTQMLNVGAGLAVPFLGIANRVGIDGEFFGLETYEVSPSARMQWWCDGPAEWRHFTDWVAGLRAFLLRCLEQAG